MILLLNVSKTSVFGTPDDPWLHECWDYPYEKGTVLGQSFMPLYESVPRAVEFDPVLYELLALVDAIRGGRARERNLAVKELKQRLGVNQ